MQDTLSLQRAELAARACRAAQRVAARFGLQAEEPRVLANTCAVRVHLWPHPVVARVSTITAILRAPIRDWLRREVELVSYLDRVGAPVVPPSELLPPGPHEEDGLGVSFWRYAPATSTEAPAPAVLGPLLGELHEALRGYPGASGLLQLTPLFVDVAQGIARAESLGTLPAGDISCLREEARALQDKVMRGALGPFQPLHGDAHAGNLIHTEAGWRWNDFEDVQLGPVAWDVATLDTDGTMLAAYPGEVDPEALALCRALRQLQAVCWTYGLAPELPDWVPYMAPMLEALRRAPR